MKNRTTRILVAAIIVSAVLYVVLNLSQKHDSEKLRELDLIVRLNNQVDNNFHSVSALMGDWLDYKADSTTTYKRMKAKWPVIEELRDRAGKIDESTADGGKLKKLLLSKIYHLYNLDLAISECCRSILWGPLGDKGLECNSSTGRMTGNRYLKRDEEFRRELDRAGRLGVADWLADVAEKRKARKAGAAMSRKNVIFILIDTLRADHLGVGGYDKPVSPFMDRLAREGVWFERCYSQAPTTVISVPSVLTGLYPYTHNLFPDTQWDNKKILSRRFRDSGYATAGISSNSLISSANGFDYGFDYFEVYNWMDARLLNNNILNYLETYRPEDRPFFIYVQYIDPHAIYFSPDDFNDERVPPRRARVDGFSLKLTQEFTNKGIDLRTYLTQEDIDYMIGLYDGEIRFIDRQLDLLFGELKAGGFLDDTIVVITSDHGEGFLEHGHLGHSRTMHEELIHVPLILYGDLEPHAKAGTKVSFPVETVDILPTIMKWVGVPVPDYVQGGDLMAPSPFTDGVNVFSLTSMGWSRKRLKEDNPLWAAVDGNKKLIFNQTDNTREFYDLSSDPGEKNNIAGRGDPDEERLMRAVSNWASKTKGALALTNPKKKNPKLLKQMKDLGYIY